MRKFKKVIMSIAMVFGIVGVCSDASVVSVSKAAGMNTSAGLDKITIKDNNGKIEIGGTEGSTKGALDSALGFIKWISLAGTLLLLGVFIVNLLKLGSSGTNVQARAAAQQGLVWSGISAAVLSIASTVFFFLGGALTDSANSSTTVD